MTQMDMFGNEGAWLERMRRNWRMAIEGDGGIGPCCDRSGKVYRFKLNQTHALSLRWIQIHGDQDGWVDVQNKAPRWILKGKNYSMLTHWGLLESKGNRSGVWRVTKKAEDWIAGRMGIPESVFIYDNRVWGESDEQTPFRGCIGKHFDFDEIMSSQFNWANLKGKA